MKTYKRHLVTAALPYANGPLHIGHLAGAYLPADIYVRYLRMMGEDVQFICGSDEHGAAITIKAKKEEKTPREIIDTYHELNKKCFEDFGISFDIYHRTSADLHHKMASDFFRKLLENGVFKEKETEQYFDEEFQQFLADRYIKGECPKCGYGEAYGDQCEHCGSDLSPTDLINPESTLNGKKPVLKKTKHWYLPMQNYQNWVKNWLSQQQQSEAWKKHVVGQCKSWLTQGLRERSMTRDLEWGVKVPVENADGKVLYVWMDAPIGYISATKALTKDWELYWKDEETKLVHFIGKDNIVFHCIIFPILLHVHGNYVLPANVPANQFLNLDQQKLSTSRNHAVWLNDFLKDYPDRKDSLRYILIANMPEKKDSDFNWEDFKEKNDKDLVGLLGGFIHRTLTLIDKHFDGTLPFDFESEQHQKSDDTLLNFRQEIDIEIRNYEFREALNSLMNLAKEGNTLLNDSEPWKLIKTNKKQTAEVLQACLLIILSIMVHLPPFLPFTASKIKQYFGFSQSDVQRVLIGDWFIVKKIAKPIHFFSRIKESEIENH